MLLPNLCAEIYSGKINKGCKKKIFDTEHWESNNTKTMDNRVPKVGYFYQ